MPFADRFDVKVRPDHCRIDRRDDGTSAGGLLMVALAAACLALFGAMLAEDQDSDGFLAGIAPSFGMPWGAGEDIAGGPAIERPSWPLIIHAAGDGRYYVDLRLGAEIVDARIDLDAERSVINPVDLLNSGIAIGSSETHVRVTNLGVGHRTIDQATLEIGSELRSETVIGRDLLEHLGSIRERSDHIRIAAD